MKKIKTITELKQLRVGAMVSLSYTYVKKQHIRNVYPVFLKITSYRSDGYPMSIDPFWGALTEPTAYVLIEHPKIVELLYF